LMLDQVIGVSEFPGQMLGQGLADCAFAGTHHAHQHNALIRHFVKSL